MLVSGAPNDNKRSARPTRTFSQILGLRNQAKTKKTKYKASINLLRKVKKITKTPVVAIGGINSNNYKNLLLNKANFLAISGYIWNNNKLKPIEAIKILK